MFGLKESRVLRGFRDAPQFDFFDRKVSEEEGAAEAEDGSEKKVLHTFKPVGKVTYSKKVLVIYNPVSGKRNDCRSQIHNCLYSFGINYHLHETKDEEDTTNIAMTFDIDDFSAILTVGGDGTIHQAVYGLLRRPDKKRVPIGFLPNGSGDDTCGSLGIDVNDVEMGLEYVAKGDLIKIDILKILIDHESEEEIERTLQSDSGKKITDYL